MGNKNFSFLFFRGRGGGCRWIYNRQAYGCKRQRTERNGFNFVYFWINQIWYVKRDVDSLLPPDTGRDVSVCKSFFYHSESE